MDENTLHSPKVAHEVIFLALASLGLGVVFTYFFFEKPPGISYPFYWFLAILTFFYICAQKKIELNGWFLTVSGLLLFFASMLAFRSSPFLSLFNVAVSCFLSLVLIKIAVGNRIREFKIVDYVLTALLPVSFAVSFFKILPEVFRLPLAIQKHELFSAVLRP